MNSKNLTLATLTAIAAASLPFGAQAGITTNLVAYWSLANGPGSSTVTDLTTNANIGTLKNFADTSFVNMWTPSTDPTNGWPYALVFTNSGAGYGTNTYVSVPDSPSLDILTTNKQWTLSAWVRPGVNGSSQPANAGIISKGNLNAEQFALYINGSGQFTTIFHNAAGSGTETVSATNSIVAGTWYHVAATVLVPRQAGSLAEALIYVDGVVRSGTNANTFTTLYNTNLPLSIGARANASGTVNLPFIGTIDEARIYDRALTASDVFELYTNEASSIILNNGVGYWNGLAGSGGNATLDTTSANFSTNVTSAPLGTPYNLANLLSLESASSLPNSCIFADSYYSNKVTFSVTSTNLTIAPGGVAIGNANGPGTLTFVNSAATYTLASSDNNGLMDGANPTFLVQAGGGTAILTGNNAFSGGTTITTGTIQVGNGGATGTSLGSGPVTNNSSLVFFGDDNPTITNTISGTGQVNQRGSGTLTLTGINSYSGGTVIIGGGTVSASSMADGGGSIGTGPFDLGGGALVYTGTGDVTVRNFNGTVGTTNSINVPNNVMLELNGRVTSTAAWVMNKLGTGTLVLGGDSLDNSSLGMTIQAGTVILNKTTSGHAIGNALTVASGATVQMGNVGYTSQIVSNASTPVTINSGGVFDLNGQSEGFYSISLAGSGAGGGALINSSSSGVTLAVVSANLAANTLIGGAGGIALPGTIAGPGSLTYAGSGTLSLQNQNTYGGGTVVNSGTLDGAVGLSIPGNVTVNSGAVLELDDVSAMPPSSTLTLNSGGTGILNFAGTENIGALYFGAVPQVAGTWGAIGSGAVNQSAAFTGTGILNVQQTYWDGNGQNAATGNILNGGGNGNWNSTSFNWWVSGNSDTQWAPNNIAYFAGVPGTVTLNANVTANGLIFTTPGYDINNTDGISALDLAGEFPTITVPAGTTTIGCNINGGGTTVGLTASGPGTLVLTGTNNYSSSTIIENGVTLSVDAVNDNGTSPISIGNITMNDATLSYFASNPDSTLRAITGISSGVNNIDVPGSAGSLGLNGQVEGTNLVKTSAGTLMLGGTLDNAGLNMAINGGTVIITKSSTSTVHGLGGGNSSVGNGATLQLAGTGGFDLYSGCILTVNSGGVLDANSQNDSFSTLTLSGSGPAGATFPGALINSTTTATSGLTNGGSGVVLAGSTTIGGPGNITLGSAVSGAHSLTYAGTGALALGTAGSYSGGTTINPGGTVQLNNQSAAGTGTITDNGTLAVNIAAGTLTNTVTGGPGSIVNIVETSGDNLTLGAPMSAFTGTINCPTSPGGAAKAQILSPIVSLPSTATINVAAGGTLYVAQNGVVIPCPVNLGGVGNSEVYGALRIESNAVVSGPVTLQGNSTTGNNQTSAAGFISGSIGDGGHGFGITKTATAGPITLTGTNTYTGPTTNLQGTLTIGGGGCLGVTATSTNYTTNILNNGVFNYASSAAQTLSGVISGTGALVEDGPGTLTLTAPNTYTGMTGITNGSTLVIGGGCCLGVTGTATNYAGTITNNGTLNYASSAAQTLSGLFSGAGVLVHSGSGSLIFNGANPYTGSILITNDATAVLSGGGTFNNTALIGIAAGSTLDVSAYSSYTLGSTTTLSAGGTGTAAGINAATIIGGPGGTVSLGTRPVSLTYTPLTFNGDATHPALYISQGALTLGGNAITVNNAGASPLGIGTYSLIQVVSGSINASATVSVTGKGLAAGTVATISTSANSVNLVVASGAVPVPAINSITLSGTSLIFSGTNGSSGGNYYVLTSTNLALPPSQWTSISTGTFSLTGTFSVTNSVGVNPNQFFMIEIP